MTHIRELYQYLFLAAVKRLFRYPEAATARTTSVLKWAVLSLVGLLGLGGTAHAVPIRTLTDLVSITFWEATGPVSARTFPPLPIPPGGNLPPTTNPGLLNRRTSPLGGSNRDFLGLTNEFYDVFYSDANGDPNIDGECLTVEAEFDSPTGGGGLNIAEVQLNFVDGSTSFMCELASAVYLGLNAIPGSAQLAVDGNLSTATVMGNTSGQPVGTRLRITLCSPCSVGEPTPTTTTTAPPTNTAPPTTTASPTTTAPPTTTPVAVPAANTWGMGLLAAAFLGAIGWMLRSRRHP